MKEAVDKVLSFIGRMSVVHIIIFVSIMGIIIIGATIILIIKGRKENSKVVEVVKPVEPLKNEIPKTETEDILGLLPDNNIKEEVVNPINNLPPVDDEPAKLLDLESLTKALENQTFEHIDMEKYEREEEERAIISYDELLQNTGNLKLNYEEENINDGLSVKKVDLNNLTSISEEIPNKTTKVQLVSYEKEEAFLQALKDLQRQLQ